MDLLSRCLPYKPDEWQPADYSNKRFLRVELNNNGQEYQKIKADFQSKFINATILKIERIQHPFAYFRFQIRKEQLKTINGYEPSVSTEYFFVTDSNKIEKILEYNCDTRHGGIQTHSLQFYNSTGHALAVKVLNNNYNTRDSHRYPEYLIQYSRATANYDAGLSYSFSRLNL